MKIALISDIHGNHVALTAVLNDIERRQPDTLICLGDVATIGPQPKEVITTLQTLDCIFIQGNHDAAVLQPERSADYNIHHTLQANLEWTISKLDLQDIAFLATFRPTYELNLGEDKTLFCFHATPQNNTDIIIHTTPIETVDKYLQGSHADIMAGGHTHIQMLRKHHNSLLINPGSVGNSFVEPPPEELPTLSPWAEYAIIEYQNGIISIHFHRLPMDIKAVHDAVRASQMPNAEWWLAQG
ncbi:MAG: metallophosphoesterase family protein [Anaerolineae bacterium]|nr:metallophosphoesterase family protein [Anaerolineae bacterium]